MSTFDDDLRVVFCYLDVVFIVFNNPHFSRRNLSIFKDNSKFTKNIELLTWGQDKSHEILIKVRGRKRIICMIGFTYQYFFFDLAQHFDYFFDFSFD